MRKYFLGMVAIVLGIALAIGTSAFKSNKKHHDRKKPVTEYYFEFTGTHGNEASTALWSELSNETAYDDFDCPGSVGGCKIITNSVTGTIPNRHPSSVPVDGNKKPTIISPTLDAGYKN